jgi:hypothetical protein
MPIDYKKYHPDWRTKIVPAIKQRAGNKCEWCGVKNHSQIQRLKTDLSQFRYRTGHECETWRKSIRVILTIAHLDHDIKNNDPSNLKALCQRCHLNYDKHYHSQNRKKNKSKLIPTSKKIG